jgi:dipeptidyl aminopeptidase/acylaminoacyl peptidase
MNNRAHVLWPLLALGLATASCSQGTAPSPSTPVAPPTAAAPTSASGPTTPVPPRSTSTSIEIADLYYLRAAGDVQLSRDGGHVAFTVQSADRPGAPYTRLFTGDLTAGTTAALAGGLEGSAPRWSPDGKRLAYFGRGPEGAAVIVVNADGTGSQAIAPVMSSNHPLPVVGERLAWSPDGTRLAYVSATPGPEPDMEADPIVITRYWYRPASGTGGRFSDNRRLHIFVADVASKQTRQLTHGTTSEHSIDWSPDGTQLAFLSNLEPDPDFVNNYEIQTIEVASGAVRRLTTTKNNEYQPSWSPDGKAIAYAGLKRPVTSSETNMEDTHVWTLDVASGVRTELGIGIDNRQGRPQWSPDGRHLYFTVQSRGSAALHRVARTGGALERVAPAEGERGTVSAFAIAKDGTVVYAMATPAAPVELFVRRGASSSALTTLNRDVLGSKQMADVEAFTFRSFDGREIEAFLTRPTTLDAGSRHPLIVMIHGGPHGQQGPAFVHKSQVYAAHGFGALMVNYRGSTGYGQAFANAIARDQNGGEAKDVLAAVDAAMAKYPWIDADRLGVEGASYGGQLSNWVVTQTTRFKAAIPWASISNLVSHNYMSVYHDYLEQEYDGKPHTGGIMDMLWERSAIRLVHKVKTPMLLSHGDNDLLVNPAEIEQYYIALRDVGVEAVMLRYPREGHSMRESGHHADFLKRSIDWYDRHFAPQRSN